MNMTLHHFLLYLDHSSTERMLVLGGSGHSPHETIYAAPLNHSALANSVTKLTLSPYLDSKPSKVRLSLKIILSTGIMEDF